MTEPEPEYRSGAYIVLWTTALGAKKFPLTVIVPLAEYEAFDRRQDEMCAFLGEWNRHCRKQFEKKHDIARNGEDGK